MLNIIDISNHQGDDGIQLESLLPFIDGCIVKATGGASFVDAYCDKFVQMLIKNGKPFGFYHFAHDIGKSDAITEADFFVNNTINYFGEGIPILDWEMNTCSIEWVNAFVKRVYERTNVWCWIYANPWRFNQGGVEPNCGRWIASYPQSRIMYLSSNPGSIPKTDGIVCCWQYSSNGRVEGYNGALDLNHYYGDAESWAKYAKGDRTEQTAINGNKCSVLSNDEYKVTIERY